MDTLTFAYYCSGHGYGHATRVSAFARHLLSLHLKRRLVVHIVSSAPRHVFADSIACGALYRFAEIDPVIVQPLAYRVDREKSVQALQNFLEKKDALLDREQRWLAEIGANCVLSDAAFLGCLAAKTAGIPSILITNFTFDSVYSYLATSLVDTPSLAPPAPSGCADSPPSLAHGSEQLLPDDPIAESTLSPLVSQLFDGYQHADLLLCLPGHIPIPSFLVQPSLPSPQWVGPILNRFYDHVTQRLLPLTRPGARLLMHPPKPFPGSGISVPRLARPAPLLVRPPSPGIYTPEGRAAFLQKTALPNFEGMKVLVVSFGGQVFKRPGGSTATSRMQSRNQSQETLSLSSYPSNLSVDSDSDARTEMRRPTNKRISKEYHGHLRNSTSHKGSALGAIDTNIDTPADGGHPKLLDFEALSRGLRSHLPRNDFSDPVKAMSPHRQSPLAHQTRHSPYRKENSDDLSSDDGNGSHQGSDQTPAERPLSPFITGTPNGAKRRHTLPSRGRHDHRFTHRRLATHSHFLVPGAPGPTTKPPNTVLRCPSLAKAFSNPHNARSGPENNGTSGEAEPASRLSALISDTSLQTKAGGQDEEISGTSQSSSAPGENSEEGNVNEGLLPDENWIAVICGVSKEQWNTENQDGGLPEGFYIAPRDVYMPDLIAVGDVVLGKLGYGMTSECVDACTPFVYVSRPLFIEEHGLRMYLEKEGVGVELDRTAYEGGEWAVKVEEAYLKGLVRKEEKRKKELEFHSRLAKLIEHAAGGGHDNEQRLSERERDGRNMAKEVVEWVEGVGKLLSRQQDKDRAGAFEVTGVSRFEDTPAPVDIKRKILVA